MKTRSVGMFAVCGVLSLLLIGGPTAQAAPTGRHCAVRLEPIARPKPQVVSARLDPIGCFDTLSEAIEAGTGGAVRLARSTQPAQLSDAMIVEATVSRVGDDTLIGTEWTSGNFVGASRNYFAPNACAGVSFEVNYVGDNWNDDFESGKGFGGCDTNKKFGHVGFGGAVLTCTPNCSDYADLRNQVSSLKWKP